MSHWRRFFRHVGHVAVSAFAVVPLAQAALLGYHDASDPVKTHGWACATDSPNPVRVHLYADVDGSLIHLDSQLANKRRDDLAFVCTGASHAFRFGDYATTADGVALLSRTSPVRIRVFVEGADGSQQPLNGSPRSVSFGAVGLHDPGLVEGRWRTDFDNPREGAADAPLLLGECLFTTPISDGYPAFSGGGDDPLSHCRYAPIVHRASNAASSEPTFPSERFWVVTANVEPALGNPLCTDGPPGQSLPLRAPGLGSVFGIAALPDGEASRPDRRKMHLVINTWNMAECRERSYAIPYLSFGAQADRGNGGVITYLNKPAARTTLSFGLTLMDIAEKNDAFRNDAKGAVRYRQSHVLIEALWRGRKRWLFIELLPDARRTFDGTADYGIDARVRFNWHMVDSFIHPGADYVFKSAALLTRQCATENLSIPVPDPAFTYVDATTRASSRLAVSLDLQRVFDCLARTGAWGVEPMPSHPVPVTGIHFGIETDDRLYSRDGVAGVAPNAMWIAVDAIDLR